MTITSEAELAGMKRIGRIVGLTLREMQRHVQPGITTAELDDIGATMFEKHGARSAPQLAYDFPGATCISINDEAAHGIPGPYAIQEGDFVNIDVSAELDGYFADTAATIPVPPISAMQKKLCTCAQRAQVKAIASIKAGRRLSVIGQAAEKEARRCGFNIIRTLTSHGVGRHIHEEPTVPNFRLPGIAQRLHDGLVITVEPFLTNGGGHIVQDNDGWTLRTADGSLSAQYEHTIVVTKGKPILLTSV